MTIDWAHFTPLSSFAGGLVIGLAAAWLVLVDGRVLGASGIVGGLVPPRGRDWGWRAALLAGLIAAPLIAGPLLHAPAPTIEASAATLVAGGLMVGFGTRLGAAAPAVTESADSRGSRPARSPQRSHSWRPDFSLSFLSAMSSDSAAR